MTELVSTARRRELGAELRRLRELRGMNGLDMAHRLEWTPSMVSRAETGKRPMTQLEVLKYTTLCGLNAAAQEQLLKLAVEPDDYRIKAHDGLPDELKTLLFHESTANAIDIYEPIFVPGLVQTEDYIRALFDETGLVDAADVEKYLEVRLSRRTVITRPNPARCTIFVHENALRMPVGGPQVMHEQMLHLLFAGSRRQCPIRVVPLSAAGRGMAPGSFHIFYPSEGSPLLYLEHPTTSEFIESAKELRAHQAILNRIASVALTEAQSREFIAWMASEYEQQGAAQDGSGPGVAQEQL